MANETALPRPPHALVVFKDGHVGSEWFAEELSRQPATRFIFEMGACITGSLAGKVAFVSEKRGCTCTKEDCQLFKRDIAQAPCIESPNARECSVLGGSHLSMASDGEAAQWRHALANASGVTIVVQTRTNLVKWAWSFLRTGAAHRFSYWQKQAQPNSTGPARIKELNHLRSESNRSKVQRVVVQPVQLLRLVRAKQRRSLRLIELARELAQLTGQRRERVLLYESMQRDMEGELRRLYGAMGAPFDVGAHRAARTGALIKYASEDLSHSIANWAELERALAPYPCLLLMLHDRHRRVFADCNGLRAGRCACSWRTPIEPVNRSALVALRAERQERRAAHAFAHGVRGRRGGSRQWPGQASGAQGGTRAEEIMARASGLIGLMLLVLLTSVARRGLWPSFGFGADKASRARPKARDAACQTGTVEVDGFHRGLAVRYPRTPRSK